MTTTILNRFEVIRPLGRGAFAETILARDTSLDRLVAIKILHPRAAQDWKAYELFEREASVLRDLRHPGIPAIHQVFRDEWEGASAAFLVMEYVEGSPLSEVIAQRRHVDAAEVVHQFVELLGILDYLHTRAPPILHRDIKPANVIIRPDGSPALVDFGAVRNVFRAPDEGGSTVVGTYGYMPYEQVMGQASPASDLYALAATVLHMVTGRPPPDFMSEEGRLAVPVSLPGGEPFRSVLARLLAAAPAERYQSARDTRAAMLAPTASAPTPLRAVVREPDMPKLTLAPAPRVITGEAEALLLRVTYTPWDLLSPEEKPGQPPTIADILLVGFLSIVTVGIFPFVFWGAHYSRKRRFRRFIAGGLPALGRVLDMTDEEIAFDKKLKRVRYEFEAEGQLYRDSDTVLPSIADRWDRGSTIQVLYLPNEDYDSVIVSTS